MPGGNHDFDPDAAAEPGPAPEAEAAAEIGAGSDVRPAPDRRLLTVLAALIAVFWLLGTVANALAPRLLADHPLLLVALEPRNRNLLLTASLVDPIPYIFFATLRRLASDPIYFALGHLYGDRAIDWMEEQVGERGGRFLRIAERGYRRFSRAAVFLFPGLLVCVMAGATGMKVRTFLAWNVVGTVCAVVALRLFAGEIEPVVSPIIEWNERNASTLTIVTVALVAAWLVVQRLRGQSELSSIRDLAGLDDDHDHRDDDGREATP